MLCVFALVFVFGLGVVGGVGQTDSWKAFRLPHPDSGRCGPPLSLAFNLDGDLVFPCFERQTLVKYVKYGKGNYTFAVEFELPAGSTCYPSLAVFHLNSGDLAATCIDVKGDQSKVLLKYTRDTSGMYITDYLSPSVPNRLCTRDRIHSIATNSAGDLLVACDDFIMKLSFDNGAFTPSFVGECNFGFGAFTPTGDVVAACDDLNDIVHVYTIVKFEKTHGGYNRTVLSNRPNGTCRSAKNLAVNAAGDIVVGCNGNDASQSIIKFANTSGTYTATYLSSISNGNCPGARAASINSAGDVVAACENADIMSSIVLYSYRQGTYYASMLSAVPGGDCLPLSVAFSPLGDVVAGCDADNIININEKNIVLYTINDDKHTRTHSITSHRLGDENDHDDL